MKKLKLDLDTLAVESFSAADRADSSQAGTVRGHATLRFCPVYTDPGNGTGTVPTGAVLCSSLPETTYC